jgi:hypothetical protein
MAETCQQRPVLSMWLEIHYLNLSNSFISILSIDWIGAISGEGMWAIDFQKECLANWLSTKWHGGSYNKVRPESALMSISPIFYKQLFHTKVFCTAFMCLQFGFVIFCQKDFGTKAAHKMLVKLTPSLPSKGDYILFDLDKVFWVWLHLWVRLKSTPVWPIRVGYWPYCKDGT